MSIYAWLLVHIKRVINLKRLLSRAINLYCYQLRSGDLDECNGMQVDGQYAYYVIDAYPYVLACFKGLVDASFNKQPPARNGKERHGKKGPPPMNGGRPDRAPPRF